MTAVRQFAWIGCLASAIAILTACGGGGSGSSFGANRVTGVAATGQAIDKGQVSLRCAAGTAAGAITNADGSYAVDLGSATLPCVARVAYADANGAPHKLHSLVKTGGTVNITPITDMVIAHLSGSGVAAAVYDSFDSAELKSFSDSQVQTAMQMVKTKLAAVGVDTSKLPSDMLSTQIQAAHGTHQGDRQDQALDDLQVQLSQQTKTLEQIEIEMHVGSEQRLSTSTGVPGDSAAGELAYNSNCAGCHGARIPDAINAGKIMNAIRENEGGMATLAKTVDGAMANNIATYMAALLGNSASVKTSQVITFIQPLDQQIGVTPSALSASASSNLPITISSNTSQVCTVMGMNLTYVGAGTCSLTASQAGNSTYSSAPPVTVSFAVKSASGLILTNQTISFVGPSALLVGTSVTLTATATSGIAVTFASATPTTCTVSGSTLMPIAVGACIVTAYQGGDAIYAAAPIITKSAVVSATTQNMQSAISGKALYASSGCAACHGSPPAINLVLNGANSPMVIRSAITGNIGGMGQFGVLTDLQLIDIAAYLAVPNI